MIITAKLEEFLKDVVGTEVSIKENVVGKVISYEKESGWANIEVNEEEFFDSLLNDFNNIGISSKSNGTLVCGEKTYTPKKSLLEKINIDRILSQIRNSFKNVTKF